VLRPGNHIDRVVSDTLIPTSPFFGAGGPASHPAFGYQGSSFWAQGLNLGNVAKF
jgi:hypothetical protein